MLAPPETLFLYELNAHVHWAAGGDAWSHTWQVIQQRLTVTLVSRYADYLLISVSDPALAPVWAFEPDLAPWEVK